MVIISRFDTEWVKIDASHPDVQAMGNMRLHNLIQRYLKQLQEQNGCIRGIEVSTR